MVTTWFATGAWTRLTDSSIWWHQVSDIVWFMCFSPSHPSPFCYPIQRRHQQTALDTSLPLASRRNGAGSHVDLVLFRFTSLMACAGKTVMCARRSPKMCIHGSVRRWSQPCLVYVHSSLHPATHMWVKHHLRMYIRQEITIHGSAQGHGSLYSMLCYVCCWIYGTTNYTLRNIT